MEITDKINLSDKAEKQILSEIRRASLINLKDDSIALLTIEDVATLVQRSYNYVANKIVKLPSFPKPVTVEKGQESHPRYIAGEVVKWLRANAKRIN